MNQPLRDLLLCFATATYEHRPVPTGGDWGSARSAARRHGLIPLANHYLTTCGEAVPREFRSLIRADWLSVAAEEIRLGNNFKIVLQALQDSTGSVIVLKGPALAQIAYPDQTLRPFNDLDLVCHEEDWVSVHRTMQSIGFVPVHDLRKPPPRVWDGKAHNHMLYLNLERALVEVHFGDFWQIGLKQRLEKQYWDRAIPVTIEGVRTKTLSVEDHILLLCVHLHKHHYARLIWFTDLALLIRSFAQTIDWPYLVATARTEGVAISVHYSLHYLNRLLNVQVPQAQINRLRPGPFRAALYNRVWPLEQVSRFSLPSRTDFQFNDVPAASDFIMNLLLMGRIREKLTYLFRLLMPSEIWLRYYYGTDDPTTLRLRRLVHAPKLIFGALKDLGEAAVHGLGLIRRHYRHLRSGKTV